MAKTCHSCPHIKSCLVAGLSEIGLQKFSDSLHRYSVQGKGKVLFNQGQPIANFYFLCNGAIKLTRLQRDGHEIILGLRTSPSTFGRCKTPQPQTYFISIVMLSKSVDLGYIEAHILEELLRDNPTFLQGVLNHLSNRSESLYKLLACMALRVRDRLLCAIGLVISSKGNGDITVPLSNIELAQLAQTTPETISRTLHELEAEGKAVISVAGNLKVKKSVLNEYVDDLS